MAHSVKDSKDKVQEEHVQGTALPAIQQVRKAKPRCADATRAHNLEQGALSDPPTKAQREASSDIVMYTFEEEEKHEEKEDEGNPGNRTNPPSRSVSALSLEAGGAQVEETKQGEDPLLPVPNEDHQADPLKITPSMTPEPIDPTIVQPAFNDPELLGQQLGNVTILIGPNNQPVGFGEPQVQVAPQERDSLSSAV